MLAPSLCTESLLFGHRQPLFSPVSFTCGPGEVWAVLGANGRGKSTLIDTLSNLQKPLGGRIRERGGISVVPQSFRPAFNWRVREIILMGRARHIALFAQPGVRDEQRVMDALERLNIAHLADSAFLTLSGGQQQLVTLARALVSGNQNILLDEPCSALDLANQQTVLQLISDLACDQQRSILFTTHDPTHALQVASHTLLLLPNGEWLAGESETIINEANLQRAYGLPVRKLAIDSYDMPVLAPLFTIKRHKTRLAQETLPLSAENKGR